MAKFQVEGRAAPTTQLTDRQVLEIRQRADEGVRKLADEFKVSPSTIRKILSGETFRHLQLADRKQTDEELNAEGERFFREMTQMSQPTAYPKEEE